MKYVATEKIHVHKTVNKIAYLKEHFIDKKIIDIGAYDETAVHNKDKKQLMHYVIASVAQSVYGFDTSEDLPQGGIKTSENSRIYKGDLQTAVQEHSALLQDANIVFAGELIEHLPNTEHFLRDLSACEALQGKELYLTTPNGIALYNAFLGLFKRESNHPDHLHMYTYKTLNTQCKRAGFAQWEIIPYHVSFPEMINATSGPMRLSVISFQKTINVMEKIFPLLSGGWIVKIKI